MVGQGVPPVGLVLLVVLGFLIATTVNTFAMEAAVLFTPAFLFVFPAVVPGFPQIGPNAAIGLALFVELFGYSSSVTAYWFRKQIDFHLARKLLVITVPVAVLARVVSYRFPPDLLMGVFGGLLLVLSVVMYEAHEHGPSVVDRLMEVPVTSLGSGDLGRLSGTEVPAHYEPRTRVRADGSAVESGTRAHAAFEALDYAMTVVGGALAGLVGIAVGELSQVTLSVRKRLPIDVSTGTSAFVLHLTIVAALVTNVALLVWAPHMAGEEFTVPFGVGTFVAVGCVFGGQMGAYLNNRLAESTIVGMLIVAYALVGLFVTTRTLFL